MKVVLREEVNRMKQIMLHEVGVSKETHTKNKSLLFESTGGGKFIDEIIQLTRGIKGVPVRSADELIEAVAKGTELRNFNPKQLENLIVDIYKGGDSAMEGTKLFDDWMGSLKNEVEKGFRKNKRLKGKTLKDVDVTYGGVTKSMSDHLDDIVNVPGGVKDRFISATKMMEDTLDDPELILDSSPDEIIKLMEDNYGDVLKLVDPDGKIIKQMEEEVLLLQNGFDRTIKGLGHLSDEMAEALIEAEKRIKLRAGMGAKYAKAIRIRLTSIFSWLIKKSPKFSKFIDMTSQVLGKFKAYLEYFKVGGTMLKDMNFHKIINLAGTGSDSALPILNIKAFQDFIMLPGRASKYAIDWLLTGGKSIEIKSLEEMSSKVGKYFWIGGGLLYTGAAFHILDVLRYFGKLLFNVPYTDVCLLKVQDKAKELGFEDIPVQEEGQKTVTGQLEDILNGKGDASGRFKDFDYYKFADAIQNPSNLWSWDDMSDQGIGYGFLGLSRTGAIGDRDKWNDFIYPYKTKKVKDKDGVETIEIVEPKVRTKPYGEVPDWAIYVAGCDANGWSMGNVFSRERSSSYRLMDDNVEDVKVFVGDVQKKVGQKYDEFKGGANDLKAQADSTGNEFKQEFNQLKNIGEKSVDLMMDKELRKQIMDLTQKCHVQKDQKACKELEETLAGIKEITKEISDSTSQSSSKNPFQ